MASTTRRRRSSYNVLPLWLTPKRLTVGIIFAIVLIVGQYGVRVAIALGHAFHTNPISAIVDAITGGGGSAIGHKQQNYERFNIMLYGYGGGGHNGAYLSDSIMLVSIQPQPNGPPQVAEISIPRDWYVPNQLAGGMQASADWLREADLDGLKSGIERQVKEHPARSLAVAVGLGYLLGKAFRK